LFRMARPAGVQRLYGIDVMALVSYDQVSYRDANTWWLAYLTIVGSYFIKSTRHEVTTLLDMAVVDPASRSILLRAGGTDERHGTTTLVSEERETRESDTESFSYATDNLVENFDAALSKFESDVREGRAQVRVAKRSGGAGRLMSCGLSCSLAWSRCASGGRGTGGTWTSRTARDTH
jgi:rhombotail lipoprotein